MQHISFILFFQVTETMMPGDLENTLGASLSSVMRYLKGFWLPLFAFRTQRHVVCLSVCLSACPPVKVSLLKRSVSYGKMIKYNYIHVNTLQCAILFYIGMLE